MPRPAHRLVATSLAAALAAPALLACGPESARRLPDPTPLAVSLSPVGTAPRLFVGSRGRAVVAPTHADAAKAYVEGLAPEWGAPAGTAALAPIATVATGVGDVVRLSQSVDGVLVAGRELRVLVRPDGTLGAASGTLIPADRARHGRFALAPADAVARAVAITHGAGPSLVADDRPAADGDVWFRGAGGAGPRVDEARARKRWYDAGGHLEAAWVVEAYSAADADAPRVAFRTVVSATDGAVLERVDLGARDVAYRVWAEPDGDRRPLDAPTADVTPHPTGLPGGALPGPVPSALVTVGGLDHPAGGGPADPWLPAGATETVGNHVDAYADVAAPDGRGPGDFRASVTAPGAFDRAYDILTGQVDLRAHQEAAITQLFYTTNWLHDDWYDAGFTEAAGNAQADNLGRGGVAGDRLLAEASDHSGRDNADMFTPDDGMSPIMQVYLFAGRGPASVTVQADGTVLAAIGANFDPPSSDLTAPLVAGADATAPPGDGCQALIGDVAGRVVLVDRGACSFKTKAANAQAAGAAGVVIANNVDTPFTGVNLTGDPAIATAVTIPIMMVTRADGVALRARLGAGPVTVRVQRARVDRDGALDNLVVAHEYGHYLHHRLTECFSPQCAAMSEGWGDFVSLHFAARPGDDLGGTFAYGGFAHAVDPYFGARRVPYSVAPARNALTFGHMASGAALPTGHPVQTNGIDNAEVHNAGEVWASMLWEGYVALQRSRSSFAETRRAMAQYVVAGLLLAPPDATVTETRDALLLAARMASPADHDVLAAAFARRGAGTCAISAPRSSEDFVGIQERFEVKGVIAPGAPVLTVDVGDCDGDPALDTGERATVRATITNPGAAALGPVTVTLTSAAPGLTIDTAPIVLPELPAYGSAPVSFEVRLVGGAAAGARAGDLTLTATAAGACDPEVAAVTTVTLDADARPGASASDAFDADPSAWTPTGDDAAAVWTHAWGTALDRHWAGADLPRTSANSLVSPPLTAGASPVSVSFDAAFDLESIQTPQVTAFFDGMVLEVSTDDGATWRDVGAMATPAYTGALVAPSHNPLAGRRAYSGRNPGYPTPSRISVALGTSLAGQTFRFRALVATDSAVGANGVALDNVAVTGLVDLPFPVQDDDAGACGPVDPPEGDDGGCCQTGAPVGGNGLAALAVLALIGGRRRRRAAPSA